MTIKSAIIQAVRGMLLVGLCAYGAGLVAADFLSTRASVGVGLFVWNLTVIAVCIGTGEWKWPPREEKP